MDCLHSMAPKDEELLRHILDDEPLLKEVEEHIKYCSACQRRLARYKYTEEYLVSRLYRSECPDVTDLNLYCASMLPPERAIRISRHIEYCPLCFHDVEDIRDILAKFEPFPTSPPSITSRTIRRIIASLVPWQPQMVLRGDDPTVAESGWPRQYRAETMNISLHLSRSSTGELLLLGLLSSDDPEQCIEAFEGTPVELHRALSFHLDEGNTHSEQELKEKPFRISSVDDLGNVAFKALPVGEYVMVVQLPASEVIIKGLTIEQD